MVWVTPQMVYMIPCLKELTGTLKVWPSINSKKMKKSVMWTWSCRSAFQKPFSKPGSCFRFFLCVCMCVCCITNLYCISLEEHPIKLWKKKKRSQSPVYCIHEQGDEQCILQISRILAQQSLIKFCKMPWFSPPRSLLKMGSEYCEKFINNFFAYNMLITSLLYLLLHW